MSDDYTKSKLELQVGSDEKILWRGKPNKRGFVLKGIINPLLPFSLIFILVDLALITLSMPSISIFFIIIMLFFTLPFWIYLLGILFINRWYKHTEYIVTDKGIYVSGGLLAYIWYMVPFTEIAGVNIRRGALGQMFCVGNIDLTVVDIRSKLGHRMITAIEAITDYSSAFEIIKNLQENIFTDNMYQIHPNSFRP